MINLRKIDFRAAADLRIIIDEFCSLFLRIMMKAQNNKHYTFSVSLTLSYMAFKIFRNLRCWTVYVKFQVKINNYFLIIWQ